jgi:hypothetical protein
MWTEKQGQGMVKLLDQISPSTGISKKKTSVFKVIVHLFF